MLPAAHRVRAYFAPVARASEAPSIFDPAALGLFPLDSPPAPWLDLGWIENFTRAAKTAIVPITGGAKGAPAALARKNLSASVELEFREWGKLQMALSSGSQHMNVLATVAGATPAASGGYGPIAAATVLAGSTSGQILLSPLGVLGFSTGDLIAVDADYAGQTGYVGSGLVGAHVKNASDVRNDANYIRRVTFNVARVINTTPTSLLLSPALLAGAPPAGWGVQKVIAFVDREGGSFFQEWSALFVVPEESGGRVVFHYPRLQPATPAAEANFPITDGAGNQAAAIHGFALQASFTALPVTDPNDNEQVLSYRSYFPAPSAAVY
jgi:hypothetical protein